MAPVPGLAPINCEEYSDDIRILCCTQTQRLNARFAGIIDEMAEKIGLNAFFSEPLRIKRRTSAR
jgi:hypothetical protein